MTAEAPDTPFDRPPWLVRDALLALLALLGLFGALIVVLVGIDLGLYELGLTNPESYAVFDVGLYVGSPACVLASLVLVARRRGPLRPSQLGIRGGQIGPVLAWTAATLALIIGIEAVWNLWLPFREPNVLDFGFGGGWLRVTTAVVALVAVAPVVEEIFCRGFLYIALRRRLRPVAAAALVGVVFGVLHYVDLESASDLPVIAAIGMILCLLYERLGTLLPLVAVHAALNALVITNDFPMLGAGVGVAVFASCLVAAGRPSSAIGSTSKG